MKQSIQIILVALLSANLALATEFGTRPLSNAKKYPVSIEKDGYSLGARLLTEKEVLQTFVTPLKGEYVVVEVALYPGTDSVDVSNDDFALRIAGLERSFLAEDPDLVATGQRQSEGGSKRVGVIPFGGVSYETGPGAYPGDRYPTRGRRYGGLRTTVGVGVVLRDSKPPTNEDWYVMETELHDKGLPQGFTNSPVAGHLYFATGKLKKKKKRKKAAHRLEYRVNGETNVLILRAK